MTERPGSPAHITIPLFPLPDVVLFPGVVLPLHIFEPRYRRLVEDVLAGDRRLGMAVLKPGWEADYEGSPDIYATVGFGVIEAASRLEDGRLLIRLRGEGKGRVEAEVQQVPYRKVVLATRPDRPPGPELGARVAELAELVRELAIEGEAEGAAFEVAAGVAFVHEVAASLPVGPEIKLELLDLDDPEERARRVTVLLEIAIAQRRAIERSRPHSGVEAELN
jgi:Lon protease-like protein